jgi:hypothetical protein
MSSNPPVEGAIQSNGFDERDVVGRVSISNDRDRGRLVSQLFGGPEANA